MDEQKEFQLDGAKRGYNFKGRILFDYVYDVKVKVKKN